MVEAEVKVKLIYKGPPHKVLVVETHKSYDVTEGSIIEVTPGEAKELLGISTKERNFSKYKEVKKHD